ncbi:MAG: M48 family metalloprotease [Pseudomonadota bacterium]
MFRRFLAALLAAGLAAGCAAPGGAPGQPAAAESSASDRRVEFAQSREVLNELRRKDMLWQDARLDRYLSGVAARIDAQRPSSAPDLRVHVLKDPEANAFTTGAGYVFVNAGMLTVMENEAQVAMILAHEAAHIDDGHVVEGMRHRQRVGLLGALAGMAGAVAGLPEEMLRLGVGLGQQYAVADFSQEHESEADRIGLQYHVGAGYDPVEGARSFEVLRRLYGEQSGLGVFLSSHPRSSERQAELVARAARMGANDGGRVGRAEYLRATEDLRRKALDFYERRDRPTFAAQARRNLR